MAALDFPNSPTVGDAFVAGNGVRYTWNGITWFAADPGATGDFMAVATTSTAITGTNAPFIFPTVVAGNASGAYSVSTGRYTPPAGRYFLSACIGLSNAGTVGCQIRKNGVAPGIANSTTTSPSWAQVQADCIADANGSDYFDVWTYSTTGVASTDKHWFLAYPISGIKGPPGDPGQLGFRLLQRTAVSSAVADVSIQNISSDINDIEFRFDLLPVAADDTLRLQFYNAAGTLLTANYVFSQGLWQHGAALNAAVGQYTSNSSGITTSILLHFFSAGNGVYNGSGGGIRGDGSVYNIRDAGRIKSANTRSAHFNNALTAQNSAVGSGTYNSNGAISGVRLFFGGGNIASGAFSVWGSP